MNAGQQTTRRIASRTGRSICRSCRDSVPRNTYSTAAAAAHVEEPIIQHIPPVAAAAPAQSYAINAGVVLSRPPQLTRDLHPLESAFYLYQRRLNERLALPFTRYFYFKKNTPADIEWKRKIKQRLTPARDIGRYKGYGAEAWNDELLVGDKESDMHWQVDRLLNDAEQSGAETPAASEGENEETPGKSTPTPATTGKGKKVEREPVERPQSRITEADKKNDVKSLNRALQRTLYLLVKNKDGRWTFPQDVLDKRETLHAAAERILVKSGGMNMNTWVVGNVPIGHFQQDLASEAVKASRSPNQLGEKTFFMKARIMAGQANLKDNAFGLKDFQWLAKDEVKKVVAENYWHSIRNMLVER